MAFVSDNLNDEPLPQSPVISLERAEQSESSIAEEHTFWKSMLGVAIFAVVLFFALNPLFQKFFIERYENGAVETLRTIPFKVYFSIGCRP